MSPFATYLTGFFVLIIGIALGAYLLDAPPQWIAVGVIVLAGLGILLATTRTKSKEPPRNPRVHERDVYREEVSHTPPREEHIRREPPRA